MATNWTVVENIAAFLMKEKGSVLEMWVGRMSYEEQRKLFGKVFGKGRIVIDGAREEVYMIVKIDYGTDVGTRGYMRFADFVV